MVKRRKTRKKASQRRKAKEKEEAGARRNQQEGPKKDLQVSLIQGNVKNFVDVLGLGINKHFVV